MTPNPALRTPLSCLAAHVLGDLRQIVYNRFTSSHHATSPSPPGTVPKAQLPHTFATQQYSSLLLNPTASYQSATSKPQFATSKPRTNGLSLPSIRNKLYLNVPICLSCQWHIDPSATRQTPQERGKRRCWCRRTRGYDHWSVGSRDWGIQMEIQERTGSSMLRCVYYIERLSVLQSQAPDGVIDIHTNDVELCHPAASLPHSPTITDKHQVATPKDVGESPQLHRPQPALLPPPRSIPSQPNTYGSITIDGRQYLPLQRNSSWPVGSTAKVPGS